MNNSSESNKFNQLFKINQDLVGIYVNSILSNLALDLMLDTSEEKHIEEAKEIVNQVLLINPDLTVKKIVDDALQPLKSKLTVASFDKARCLISCFFTGKNQKQCNEQCNTQQILPIDER